MLRAHQEAPALAKPSVELVIRKWGNNLAVRIPSVVARSARLSAGQPVRITASRHGLVVRPLGPRRLSLAEKLAQFDSRVHGGDAMAVAPLGTEIP
jgi:antitoxin MazE